MIRFMSTVELSLPTSERKGAKTEWHSLDLYRYLAQVGHDPQNLLPLYEYPQTIHLNQYWNNVLNGIRETTISRKRERWSYVGIRDHGDYAYLPPHSTEGLHYQIPAQTIEQAMIQASETELINHFPFDIHSHPEEGKERLLKPLQKALGLKTGGFSDVDLYPLVTGLGSISGMALVTGTENVFIFQSAETEHFALDPRGTDLAEFYFMWQPFLKRKQLFRWRKFTKAVARRYCLALYSGFVDQPLERVHPC